MLDHEESAGGADGSEHDDPAAFAQRIRHRVAEMGYAHVEWPVPERWFEDTALRLGRIAERTDIRLDERQRRALAASRSPVLVAPRPSVHAPQALGYHTDRPTSDLLGWHCVEQDAAAGSILLIDTRDIAEHLDPSEISGLRRIDVPYTVRDPESGEERVFREPLLSGEASALRIYYAPWLLPAARDEREARLFERLASYVERKHAEGPLGIRLERGECFFIDNRRMLHGRGPLPADSRRHLVRLYIQTESTTPGVEGPAA